MPHPIYTYGSPAQNIDVTHKHREGTHSPYPRKSHMHVRHHTPTSRMTHPPRLDLTNTCTPHTQHIWHMCTWPNTHTKPAGMHSTNTECTYVTRTQADITHASHHYTGTTHTTPKTSQKGQTCTPPRNPRKGTHNKQKSHTTPTTPT